MLEPGIFWNTPADLKRREDEAWARWRKTHMDNMWLPDPVGFLNETRDQLFIDGRLD